MVGEVLFVVIEVKMLLVDRKNNLVHLFLTLLCKLLP